MIRALVLQQIGNPDGCAWYRLLQFTKSANRQKLADCQYLDLNLEEDDLKAVLLKADVFLVRLSSMLPMVLDHLKEQDIKKPVVLDIDDAIDDINPLADHYRTYGTKEVQLKDGSWLWKDGVGGFDHFSNRGRVEAYRECINRADAIITTTFGMKEWLEYETKAPIAIIPNAVNLDLFPKANDPNKKEIRLVWSGGASHFADLQEIEPALARVMAKYPNLHYYSYGMHFGAIARNLPKDRYHTAGWVHPEAHGYRLACLDPDISICPLIDSEFNRVKSSIKYCEMSALGVPTLAKNIPPYADDIKDGENGLLYDGIDDFEVKLSELVEDGMLRIRLGQSAQDYVRANRQLDDITKDWVEFLEACGEK